MVSCQRFYQVTSTMQDRSVPPHAKFNLKIDVKKEGFRMFNSKDTE